LLRVDDYLRATCTGETIDEVGYAPGGAVNADPSCR
jgi:hypothetical protein